MSWKATYTDGTTIIEGDEVPGLTVSELHDGQPTGRYVGVNYGAKFLNFRKLAQFQLYEEDKLIYTELIDEKERAKTNLIYRKRSSLSLKTGELLQNVYIIGKLTSDYFYTAKIISTSGDVLYFGEFDLELFEEELKF